MTNGQHPEYSKVSDKRKTQSTSSTANGVTQLVIFECEFIVMHAELPFPLAMLVTDRVFLVVET